MLIFTGCPGGSQEKLGHIKRLGMGVMLSAPEVVPKGLSGVRCALDNGAYQSWLRGFPFMESRFWKTIDKAYAAGVSFDFVVCPDIVAGGMRSLDFSMEWANGKLQTAQRLALAVQDGIPFDAVFNDPSVYRRFSRIFVGGTTEWKWETAPEWVRRGHENNLPVHIGRVGTLPNLEAAEKIGADSVDSTNFVRHDAWETVEAFVNKRQPSLISLLAKRDKTVEDEEIDRGSLRMD